MKRIISPDEYTDARNSGAKFIAIDVRTVEEFAESHIEGAINVPVLNIESEISTIAPDKDAEIILNCRSGGRAGRMLTLLEKMGYTNGHALKGSYLDVT